MTATIVHTLSPLSDPRWDDLVAHHPKASIFHERAWLEALRRTYGYEPVVFTTSSPTTELKNGLLFCDVHSWLTGRRLVSLPFSDHCELVCDSTEEIQSLIRHSQTAVDSRRWRYLEVRPTDEEFGETGVQLGLQPIGRYFLHVMDLRPSIDGLFRSLDKDSVQRRVNRAERAGLIEKCGNSSDLLKEFYGLFVITRARHHLPPPPYTWFQNLLQTQGDALEVRVAYKDLIPIAAILTLRFRAIGYFKYGCSDTAFKNLGATPWLLWKAIVAAKAKGALKFDLGRTDAHNAGLLAFKNNWVSAYKSLTYWRFPAATSSDMGANWKIKMAKRVFSRMPLGLLEMSGRVVYRHIG